MAVKGLKVGSLNTSDDVSGLVKIVPTSVAVGSGSGSANSNGTVSFSGASSVSFNGCFTSTYTNYRIVIALESSSTGAECVVRFRTNGTDNSSNVYYGNRQGSYAYNTGHFSTSVNPSTSSTGVVATDFTSRGGLATMDISNPFEAKGTFVKFLTNYGYFQAHGAFMHDSATQFDGISFIPNSGTIIGNISVYGYTI